MLQRSSRRSFDPRRSDELVRFLCELLRLVVIVKLSGQQRALGERDDLGLGGTVLGSARRGGGEDLVGLLVLVEQEQRRSLRDQRAGAPVAPLRQARQRRPRVREHPLRALSAQPGVEHADPGLDRAASVGELA